MHMKHPDISDEARFVPVACTPKQLVELLDYSDKGIESLNYSGEKYQITPRFRKSLATQLGVPSGIYKLFSPQEVKNMQTTDSIVITLINLAILVPIICLPI